MLVLSAGMSRSGSTWLYNLNRFFLNQKYSVDSIQSGWIDDLDLTAQQYQHSLVKLHNFDSGLVKQSQLIVYSFRDIRDVLASCKRKFDLEPDLTFARHLIEQDKIWKSKANVSLQYEWMMKNQQAAIAKIATLFECEKFDKDQLKVWLERCEASGSQEDGEYNKETLYHPNHITDGRHGSWYGTLSRDFVMTIESEFSDWLYTNNYEIKS